jgi:heptosyltransferase-1
VETKISSVDRARASFAITSKRFLNACLHVLRALLFLGTRPPANTQRIIVHLIGNVGDIVVAIPALIALRERYPDSQLVLFTSAGHRDRNLVGAFDLLDGAGFLDRIETYTLEDIADVKGMLGLLRRFKSFQPDLIVSLPPCDIPFASVVRNLIFARMAGARFAVGYEHINMNLFPFAQAQRLSPLPSEISRNLHLLRELGIDRSKIRFEFGPIADTEKRHIDHILKNDQRFVAICPGGRQVGRRWPAERFAAVARRLRRQGLGLVAVGTEKERALCEEIVTQAGGGIVLAGDTSLRGTIEVLARAQFLLTNDTGPMHLAYAIGKPVVAIFGTRDFAGRWLPYGEGHEVFRAVMNCPRCLFVEDDSDHCVRKIPIEEVYAGCERVLERLHYVKRERIGDSRFQPGDELVSSVAASNAQ